MFELLLTLAALLPPATVDVWHDGTGMVVTVESEGRGYELWMNSEGQVQGGAYDIFLGDSI